ncbi:HD domain-containing protein [Patescibacteria group bacterium]|nr:HD domain-containing protein [Patescibacteria group bacterium]
MEDIYIKILELARPYYEKGRVYDLDQIDWMIKQADRLADNLGLDKRILMPLVILHDVGYAFIQEHNPNIKDQESKRVHLEEGVKIARKILEQVNYDSELTEKIVYFVSVHDNWVFGDNQPYKDSKLLSLFNDLDFLYAQSSYEAFKYHGDSMGIPVEKMYDFWMNDEKLKRRPFCCPETKALFEDFMNQRKQEINKK